MDKKLECSSGGPVDVASGCGLRIRLWEFLPAVDVATGCGRRFRLWESLRALSRFIIITRRVLASSLDFCATRFRVDAS